MLARSKKPNLLFVSNNDGSDMRINKEIRTLSRDFEVHFLGVGEVSEKSFARAHCSSFTLVRGPVRSIRSLANLVRLVLQARRKLNLGSIQVVDEQMLAVIWPALLGRRIVLDVFDSIFLRINKPNDELWIFKRMLYSFTSKVIVTDTNRQELLASFVKPKSLVIPNVPFRSAASEISKQRQEGLTIAYFGSLAENRGTAFVRELLETGTQIRVLCAGWPADETSRRLLEHPSVEYFGVIKQQEANEIIAREADYIVSVYPSGDMNNYYASPNKVYDAIHTRTPLIIGDNVKVSEFVREHELGFIVDDALLSDPTVLAEALLERRESFSIKRSLIDRYCWESYEDTLINAHLS